MTPMLAAEQAMRHFEPQAPPRHSSGSGGGYVFLIPAAAYLVGGAVFFRWQLFSGFDLLSGNSGDTRFIIAIQAPVPGAARLGHAAFAAVLL
jgi:hypothetical protein